MAANPSIGRAGVAAGELYDRHHRRVHAFCLSQLRDGEEAAEATQTTFVNALGALREGVKPRLELPWLLAIARNVCRKRWDARRRRRRLELVVDPHDLAELAPAPPRTDLLDGVGAALAALPELQRRAVVLRDWQGLSYKEVAAELGVTLAAAETLIFRGRATLARGLAGEEPTERRRFGLGSLLRLLESGTLGAAPAAKLAAGAVAVVCAGVGTHELVRPAPRPVPAPVRATAVASPVRARGTFPRSDAAVPVRTPPRRREQAARRHPSHAVIPTVAAPAPRAELAPTPTTADGPAPSAAAPAAPPPAPPAPTPTAGAPAAPPPAPASPTPSAGAPAAAPPAPAPPTPTPRPATTVAPTPTPAPPTPPASVTDVAAPVGTAVTQAVPPVVTTVTQTVTPVVTTVIDAVPPLAPVITTVTSALPPLPPVHLP